MIHDFCLKIKQFKVSLIYDNNRGKPGCDKLQIHPYPSSFEGKMLKIQLTTYSSLYTFITTVIHKSQLNNMEIKPSGPKWVTLKQANMYK